MTVASSTIPPKPGWKTGLVTLRSFAIDRNLISALSTLHQEMGNVFRLSLPGFNPFVLVGPDANRFVLASGRDGFHWRNEQDPVTDLLQHGLLVLDGEDHDKMRRLMSPALHRRMLEGYFSTMLQSTDEVLNTWRPERTVNLLVEMRRIALLILARTLFRVDFSDNLGRLWPSILKSLEFISPGLWVVWPALRRPGYPTAIGQLDKYLYQLIADRRDAGGTGDDLLGLLANHEGLSDEWIRDQLLTMLIAGHDTSTSFLTWALYLISAHPKIEGAIREELDAVLRGRSPVLEDLEHLPLLDQAVKETLRLYPPIHIGARVAARDLNFQGYRIPASSRVMYSIYLTHRLPRYWPEPDRFRPQRFTPQMMGNLPPYTYLPFGGGPRNCIGFAFAQVEMRLVLARILQRFQFHLDTRPPRLHMGATLEPRPGIFAKPLSRSTSAL